MSTEFNVVVIALESIKNDDISQLDQALKIMPLEKLVDKHEILLSNFLALCAQYKRGEASKLILERWKVIYPDNDKISMLTRLFMKLIINVPTLAFLASIHSDYTYVELMDELSEWDSSEAVVTACERAEQIFGNQSYDTYRMLRERAVEMGNFRIEEYMIDKITEIAPFAPKPGYVNNFLSVYDPRFKDRLPTQKELDEMAETESQKMDQELEDIKLPDDEETIRLLTEGLLDAGISIEEIEIAKKILKEQISSSTDRKRELLMPILKNKKELDLETDRLLYWIYAASNPLVNQNLTLDTPSAKYGGCRMFLCELFDYDEDGGYFEDWFTGSCDECLLRIAHRHYAVRMPRIHGGWEGIFCSWKCVKDRLKFIEAEQVEPNLLLRSMIDAFEKKTNEIGIQDRSE